MIAIIRITGQVNLKREIVETLHRLRIRRKYACVVLEKPTKEQLGMIKKVKDFVAFGEIDADTYKELKEKRGKMQATKLPTSSAEASSNERSKRKLKPFFRLHPPRGGIESKKHFGVGKGVLGNNKKMNELIRRML